MEVVKSEILKVCEFEIVCRVCGKRLGFAEIPVQAVCETCKRPVPETIEIENLLKILEDSRNSNNPDSATLAVTESGKVLSKTGKEKTWLKIV